HNKVAWSQRKCRTRADVDAALFLAVGARALLNARLSKFRPLNLSQKFFANDIDSAGRGHRRVTRGGHKSVGRIAYKGQGTSAFEGPLPPKPLDQAKHHRRARQAEFICASSVEHVSPPRLRRIARSCLGINKG